MTEYPDYGRLLENISVIHGELSPKEKVIAFLAYSLGAVDYGDLLKEEAKGTIEWTDPGRRMEV